MKHIDSLKQIQTLLSNQGSQAQLLNISNLKIEIKNEKIKCADLFNLLHTAFPNVKELILQLDKTELKDDFLSNFQIFLEQNTQIEQLYIQLYRNKFQIRSTQAFILYVRNKFYNNQPIDYIYKYNNIAISCGFCQISFENDFKSSIWLNYLKQNTYSMNIKQNQQHLIELLYKYIKIDNIKVELFHQNKLYASLSNGSQQFFILKLKFDEVDDLQQFKIHEHQIAEINIPIKDLQILGFNKCFLLQQIKKRHNFSFRIQEIVTIFSFKEENIPISNREYIQECLKKYDLSNSNKMNLNTKFKMQFYKDLILENQLKSNSLNGYDINLYLVQNNQRELITKIQCNLSQKNKRERFEIDLESISDVIEIIQQYVYELQKVEQCQNIKFKFIDFESQNAEMKNNFLNEVAKINFMKTKVQKLSIDLTNLKAIKEYPFISQINSLQNLSLKIIDHNALFEFLEKNRGNFRRLHNLINLDIQFYDELSRIQIFDYIKKSYRNNFNNEYDYFFDDGNYYKFLKQKYHNDLEQKGKAHFAYLAIENHDDNQCSYTRREFCTCQNNKMQKLLKKPTQFFMDIEQYESYYYSDDY
ncbi:hypothetical protein ABPG74_000424 [Tetrahymena malaccensis]